MTDWSRFPNFSESELACRCGCGRADMDDGFMEKLQLLRDAMGRPLPISSGFRCPDYNDQVSSTGRDGPHVTGHAADVLISGADALRLLALAANMMTGVGVSQKGRHDKRFLHLDDLTAPAHPRPALWSY